MHQPRRRADHASHAVFLTYVAVLIAYDGVSYFLNGQWIGLVEWPVQTQLSAISPWTLDTLPVLYALMWSQIDRFTQKVREKSVFSCLVVCVCICC